MRRMPAEWEWQSAVLIAWPHSGTDWRDSLQIVEQCYISIAEAITADEQLIIVTPDITSARKATQHLDQSRISFQQIQTNDTWTRDYGPISVHTQSETQLLDFGFNAWGNKYPYSFDNSVCAKLAVNGALPHPLINQHEFILEGGSIESDGKGTILTTPSCLLNPNRNPTLNKSQIELQLQESLGAQNVIWLECSPLPGDDTDGHIDTLARFAPNDVILFSSPLIAKQLANATKDKFNLIPLPQPRTIIGSEGQPLPATYANFLVTNNSVLVPTYRQPEQDQEALCTISKAFPGRKAVPIDCTPLIAQHGSLHCSTMQIH